MNLNVLMEYMSDMLFVYAMIIGAIVAFIYFLVKKRQT